MILLCLYKLQYVRTSLDDTIMSSDDSSYIDPKGRIYLFRDHR